MRHSHGFRHGDGLEVDLHWSDFLGQCDPDSDDLRWEKSRPLAALNRVSQASPSPLLRVPDPAQHLLLLLTHDSRWEVNLPIRWITDAVMLLRSKPQLDWAQFLDTARRRCLTLMGADLLGLTRFSGQVVRGHAMTIRLSFDDQPDQIKTPVHGTAKAVGQ